FLLKRLRTMLHINDRKRADNYLRILDPTGPAFESFDEELRAYARMLVLSFWANQPQKLVPARFTEALNCLRRFPAVREELRQIMEYAISSSRVIPRDSGVSILQSHADYSLAELIGALEDKPLKDMISLPREGVRSIERQRTTLASPSGQRYIHHKERGNNIVMATRFHSDNEVGTAAAYTFLGKIDYVSHRGEKPIQFEWALHRSMPKKVFVDGRTVA